MRSWKEIVIGSILMLNVFILSGQERGLTGLEPGAASFDFVFDQIFDNREYFSDYAFAQTIFGSRIDVQASFKIDSMHRVATGINYMYEHGSSILAIKPTVDLYYQYSGKNLDMSFGSFPRRNKLEMPLYFLTDTLNYYRPNIEGALLDYSWNWGEALVFIDWTGRVSEIERETFLLGIDARIGKKLLHIRPSFVMYHNARSYYPYDSIPLQDNGIMSLVTGTDLSGKTFFDKFVFSTGVLASYNRFRPDPYGWGRGWISNLDLGYNIFGMKGVYYYGTPIDFRYGDSFYTSGNYGRLDLFVDPFKHKNVNIRVDWGLHFLAGEGLHHSQQVLIKVRF